MVPVKIGGARLQFADPGILALRPAAHLVDAEQIFLIEILLRGILRGLFPVEEMVRRMD